LWACKHFSPSAEIIKLLAYADIWRKQGIIDVHTNNIELLRDEAQRLLQLNVEGLEQMMAAKGVITEAKEGSQQTFDRTSTPKYIEVLKGELTKLENMELVIAVVGTMKAGKSTTINAIVGTEVLPNRNRPMTALPTLIRHTPGQIEPILKFENNEPINVLFGSIRQHIATGKVNDVLEDLSDDIDMKELIGNITSKQNFGKHYQGAANIFWCLKTLNDLVRLSNKLNVPFPFSSYNNIGQMPVITVEFAHLREAGKTHGQLTLLDTPGPNESGQDHLRDMLTEQLKKTSAVLAVFDYTQLKSDADEQVRNEIKSIAQLHKGRLFALVNKFDQKDRNGDGKEAVQALVADKLMDGLLDRKHVFPVSSKWGYLANRALNEIALHGTLPDLGEKSWVADFAKEAELGRKWKETIKDKSEVEDSANYLWGKSGFHEPMENVIRAAHTKAALLSIDSAAEKLVKCANDVENFLGARRGALSQSAEDLKIRIDALKSDIVKVEYMEKKTQGKVKLTLETLKEKTTATVNEAKKNSEATVGKYFAEGKTAEKALREKQGVAIKTNSSNRSNKAAECTASENKPHWNANEKSIKFKEKGDAKKLVEKMQDAIEKSIIDEKQQLSRNIESTLEEFLTDFGKEAELARKIIFDMNSSMVDDGFNINLKLPDINKLNKVFRSDDFSLVDKIHAGTRKETEYYEVEKRGIWSWFSQLWDGGYETHSRTIEVPEFVIEIEKIQAFVQSSVDKIFNSYTETMEKEIIKPLRSEVDDFFEMLKGTIENIRGDLQQGLDDKQGEAAELDDLKISLAHFQVGIPAIKEDSEALSYDVNCLKSVKVTA
jgi:GTPase SAR1 family protein